jgi:hypothetical protein
VAGVPIPFESEGACPFECCVYRTWEARRAIDVRAGRDARAPVAFSLEPGDTADALTGVVVVTRAGRARAPKDVQIDGLGKVRAGEEVAVLHPLGEGFWLVWRDGRTGSAEVARPAPGAGPWQPQLHEVALPEYDWWVQMRGRAGTGWTDQPQDFGNKDRCG